MPTLNLPKTYDDGTVLTEAQLDEITLCTEIFFNSTKIDSDNVQTGGIATANLADQSITEHELAAAIAGTGLIGLGGSKLNTCTDNATLNTNTSTLKLQAKPLGITAVKLGASTVVTSSIAYAGSTTTSGIFVNTGVSQSFTKLSGSARAAMIILSANGSKISGVSTAGTVGEIAIYADETLLSSSQVSRVINNNGHFGPLIALHYGVASTYIYTVRFKVTSGGGNISLTTTSQLQITEI